MSILNEKSQQSSDEFELKIETQISHYNPFEGMVDERVKNKTTKKVNNSDKFLGTLGIILLVSLYYSLILKNSNSVTITKIYHSVCLSSILLIDSYINSQDFKRLTFHDEDKRDMSENLLSSYPLSIQTIKRFNKSISRKKFILYSVTVGILYFASELMTYYFIQYYHENNLGLVLSLFSLEFVFIRLSYYLEGKRIYFLNILGAILVYFLSASITVIYFNILILIFCLIICCLRYIIYYIRKQLGSYAEGKFLLIVVLSDLFLGLTTFFIFLYANYFEILSLSNFILIFFATCCFYSFIKQFLHNDLNELSIYSLIFPCLGFCDLIINNKLIDLVNLVFMFSFSGAVSLLLVGGEINLFESKEITSSNRGLRNSQKKSSNQADPLKPKRQKSLTL